MYKKDLCHRSFVGKDWICTQTYCHRTVVSLAELRLSIYSYSTYKLEYNTTSLSTANADIEEDSRALCTC